MSDFTPNCGPLERWKQVIELTKAHSLTGSQARVLHFMAMCDGPGGGAYPSIDTISESVGISRRGVIDALGKLCGLGILRRVGKHGEDPRRRTVIYRFCGVNSGSPLRVTTGESWGAKRRAGFAP